MRIRGWLIFRHEWDEINSVQPWFSPEFRRLSGIGMRAAKAAGQCKIVIFARLFRQDGLQCRMAGAERHY